MGKLRFLINVVLVALFVLVAGNQVTFAAEKSDTDSAIINSVKTGKLSTIKENVQYEVLYQNGKKAFLVQLDANVNGKKTTATIDKVQDGNTIIAFKLNNAVVKAAIVFEDGTVTYFKTVEQALKNTTVATVTNETGVSSFVGVKQQQSKISSFVGVQQEEAISSFVGYQE